MTNGKQSATQFYIFAEIDTDIEMAFIDWLSNIPWTVKEVDVYIDSQGGGLTESYAIAHMIKRAPCTVNTHVVGEACSGATIIAISGDHRTMGKMAGYMIHPASWGARGREPDMKEVANHMKRIYRQMAHYYADHSKLTFKEVKRLLLKQTDVWMGAKEALKYGLIDEIV